MNELIKHPVVVVAAVLGFISALANGAGLIDGVTGAAVLGGIAMVVIWVARKFNAGH